MTNLAGLYGTLLEDNNLSYSVQTGYAGGGNGDSGSTAMRRRSTRGGYGNANVGYSRSDGFKQLYYGVSGGCWRTPAASPLSQPLNDTVVLVKAPGAGGVKVENQTGVRTDWRGYAVLPYATEYRENRIALDTTTPGETMSTLDDAVVSVECPPMGRLSAPTQRPVGMKILMTLTHRGKPLPFGASPPATATTSGASIRRGQRPGLPERDASWRAKSG